MAMWIFASSPAFDVYEKEFGNIFPDVHLKAFIKKPITIDELARRINQLVDAQVRIG